MKLIDFHTHIYPDAVAQKATQSVESFYDSEALCVGTQKELERVNALSGVELSVILPVAVKPSGVVHINDYALSVQKDNPRFYSFGTIHAAMENIEDEAIRIYANGLHGIKLHPDTQFFDIDDSRMFPVYDIIQGKIPLIVHAGDPRYSYSHPERLRRVMENFPSLVCIAAHFGGWSMVDEGIRNLADKENCYVDMSSSFKWNTEEKLNEAVFAYGEDRVLFGSDFPLGSPVVEKENLIKMKISDEAKEKIAYKNAEKLLGIKI